MRSTFVSKEGKKGPNRKGSFFWRQGREEPAFWTSCRQKPWLEIGLGRHKPMAHHCGHPSRAALSASSLFLGVRQAGVPAGAKCKQYRQQTSKMKVIPQTSWGFGGEGSCRESPGLKSRTQIAAMPSHAYAQPEITPSAGRADRKLLPWGALHHGVTSQQRFVRAVFLQVSHCTASLGTMTHAWGPINHPQANLKACRHQQHHSEFFPWPRQPLLPIHRIRTPRFLLSVPPTHMKKQCRGEPELFPA